MKTSTQDLNGNAIIAAGSYRSTMGKGDAFQLNWELAQGKQGPIFSMLCPSETFETILAGCPNPTARRMAEIGQLYNGNGWQAGTVEQAAHLKSEQAKNPDDLKAAPYNGDWYNWAVAKLKSAGLYRVFLPLKDGRFTRDLYTYGESWLTHPIPAEIVNEIKGWAKLDNAEGLSSYDHQARDFLARYGIKCRITLSDTKPANWSPAGHHYRVTLSKKSARFVFDFWGSAKDAENKEDPSAYDVLACLVSESNAPFSFADYCSEFGVDSDSIGARQTFNRLAAFAKRIRAFFTAAELESLSEIQ